MTNSEQQPNEQRQPDFYKACVSRRFILVTFLIYTLIFEGLVIGGCGYVVFVLGHSGWWWVLAALFSSAQLKPLDWHCLLTGEPKPNKAE